jgi:hypothetical protein
MATNRRKPETVAEAVPVPVLTLTLTGSLTDTTITFGELDVQSDALDADAVNALMPALLAHMFHGVIAGQLAAETVAGLTVPRGGVVS